MNQTMDKTHADVVTFQVESNLDRFGYRSLSGMENIIYHALRRALAQQSQPVPPMTASQVLWILRSVPANLTLEDFVDALPGLRASGALTEIDFGWRSLDGRIELHAPCDFLGRPWPLKPGFRPEQADATEPNSTDPAPIRPEAKPVARHSRASGLRFLSSLLHVFHHPPLPPAPGAVQPSAAKG